MQTPFTVFKSGSGTLTTAGQRKQLSVTSIPCGKIFISAGKNNNGDLVLGDNTVVGAVSGRIGAVMQAGGGFTIEIDDLSKIWIDGESSGDTYSYSYLA